MGGDTRAPACTCVSLVGERTCEVGGHVRFLCLVLLGNVFLMCFGDLHGCLVKLVGGRNFFLRLIRLSPVNEPRLNRK